MSPRAWTLAAALVAGAIAPVLAAAPSPMSAAAPRADPAVARGEEAYGRCLACHALAYDRVGPRHCGVVGRHAGSVPGFPYSDAMKRSRLTWDPKTLDRFLAAPTRVVPGTAMTYDGVPDPQVRADLIAYLKHAATTDACHHTP